MHYVVLAYPILSKTDYEWIQNIRQVHDRQFTMVKPHFTVVFPTAKLSEPEMLEHVKSVELKVKPLDFTLTKAVVKENFHPKYFQVHLVAAEPLVQIITLHDLLYRDALASELRSDIEYLPHITIASNEDESTMRKLASEINNKGVAIQGKIDKLDVSSFDGEKVIDIEQLQLQ